MTDESVLGGSERVSTSGATVGPDYYWYRGVVQYHGGPPTGYIVTTPETAAIKYVWHGSEELRDDPEADARWLERRPMDCWERVADA